jgi:hypothetical protein
LLIRAHNVTTPVRFDPEVIEGRRALLEQYANAVMGTPALAKSAVMHTFLASGVLPDTPASNTPSLAQSHSPAADRPASGTNVSAQGSVEGDILVRNVEGAMRSRGVSLGGGVSEKHRREEAAAAARKSYTSACDA